MLTTFEQFKTFYNALIQKLKGFKSNWNQNDPTADDYIKNRTHWTEIKSLEYFSNNAVIVEDGWAEYHVPVPCVEGQDYTVIFNNISYNLTLRQIEYFYYLGDLTYLGETDGIDEDVPFGILFEGDYVVIFAENGTHNISIIQNNVETVHKIDEKYLPDIKSMMCINVINNYDTLEADKTYNEIYTAILNQEIPYATLFGRHYYLSNAAIDMENPLIIFSYSGDGYIETITFYDDGYIDWQRFDYLYEREQTLRAIIDTKASKDDIATRTENGLMSYEDKIKTNDILINSTDILVSNIYMRDQVNNNTYVVQMRNGTLVSTFVPTLTITSNPTKMAYYDGDGEGAIDTTGMTLALTYEDGTIKEITEGFTTYLEGNLSFDNKKIKIMYTENGIISSTTIDVNIVPFDPTVVLIDFNYTDNNDGTYILNSWKQTLNGVTSTELIVPDNNKIIV